MEVGGAIAGSGKNAIPSAPQDDMDAMQAKLNELKGLWTDI